MEQIKLVISFSLKEEIQRVKDTILRIPWYRENGYEHFITKIPKTLTENSTAEEIVQAVTNEYSDDNYKDAYSFIESEWLKFRPKIGSLLEMKNFKLHEKYTLILTRYGSGGSYNSKIAEILINIESKNKDGLIGTIVHEMVHIGIQKYIDEYSVSHWKKERLVDLVCEKYFPGLRKMQNIAENTESVNCAFQEYMPDIHMVIKSI